MVRRWIAMDWTIARDTSVAGDVPRGTSTFHHTRLLRLFNVKHIFEKLQQWVYLIENKIKLNALIDADYGKSPKIFRSQTRRRFRVLFFWFLLNYTTFQKMNHLSLDGADVNISTYF